jgi:hypothetical protein
MKIFRKFKRIIKRSYNEIFIQKVNEIEKYNPLFPKLLYAITINIDLGFNVTKDPQIMDYFQKLSNIILINKEFYNRTNEYSIDKQLDPDQILFNEKYPYNNILELKMAELPTTYYKYNGQEFCLKKSTFEIIKQITPLDINEDVNHRVIMKGLFLLFLEYYSFERREKLNRLFIEYISILKKKENFVLMGYYQIRHSLFLFNRYKDNKETTAEELLKLSYLNYTGIAEKYINYVSDDINAMKNCKIAFEKNYMNTLMTKAVKYYKIGSTYLAYQDFYFITNEFPGVI